MPDIGSPEDEQLTRFLKYVVLQAAIDPDLRKKLVGAPQVKHTAGKPDRLVVVPPPADVRLAALRVVFDKFNGDPAEIDAIAQAIKDGSFEDLKLGEVDFVELWGGGSYIVDSATRFRVLIAPTPTPIAYKVGIVTASATPKDPKTGDGGCPT